MPAVPASTPPEQQPEQAEIDQTDIITTNLYRFSGYKYVRDMTGNILYTRRPTYQPYEWSQRGLGGFNSNLRSP